MPEITVIFTDLEYEGVRAAQEFNNPEMTPEQYWQKVATFAAESYMKQFGVERPTIESLSLKLGKAQDDLATATAESADLQRKLDSVESALEAAKAEPLEVTHHPV